MRKPKRIQRKRARGWRMPAGAKSCCRPHKFGNPFRIGPEYLTAQDAVDAFRKMVEGNPSYQEQIRAELQGHDLACFCRLDQPCHVDVLLEYANFKTVDMAEDTPPVQREVESQEWLETYRAHDFKRINIEDNDNLEYRIDDPKFEHLGVKRTRRPNSKSGEGAIHGFWLIGTEEEWKEYTDQLDEASKEPLLS